MGRIDLNLNESGTHKIMKITKLQQKIKKIRNNLSEKIATPERLELIANKLDLINHIHKKDTIDHVFNNKNHSNKHVLITKDELIWIMDNIHSSQTTIQQLRTKLKDLDQYCCTTDKTGSALNLIAKNKKMMK